MNERVSKTGMRDNPTETTGGAAISALRPHGEAIMDMQQMYASGTDVYGADGEKVGTVAGGGGSFIVVEKGFFFPKDYYIPIDAVAQADGDGIYLSVTKDQALNQGWDREPVDTMTTAAPVDTEVQFDDQRTTGVTDQGDVNVPVYEEHLEASKRRVEGGEVTINKHVVTEQETLEVPVTEERVRVDWRAPSGDGADGAAFEEGVIEIPVSHEEVDVSKRTVQTGEVHVSKEQEQRTQRVTDSVRREVVDVEDTTGEPLRPER